MLLSLLFSCGSDKVSPIQDLPALDLNESLDESTARAGQIIDPQSLFGGASAEGQVGDYKIYNGRVRFIIQSDRNSAYYVGYGGHIIDADIVRNDGSLGRDVIDDWMPMLGLGRIVMPNSIEVIDDGRNGTTAHIRSVGTCTSFSLLEGAVENDSFITDYDCTLTTNFYLEPNSPLLKMESIVEWNDEATTLQFGDFGMVALEVSDFWNPTKGMDGTGDGSWMGLIGEKNEFSLGLFSDGTPYPPSTVQDILSTTGPVLSGFYDYVTVEEGESYSYTRYFGIAEDFNTLTSAWYETQNVSTEHFIGAVSSNNVPVEGARVHFIKDDGPITMAITDESGAWEADLPAGEDYSVLASGRGNYAIFDYPAGHGHYAIYAQDIFKYSVLDSFSTESSAYPAPPFVDGLESTAISPLVNGQELILAQGGTLEIRNSDGRPTLVILEFIEDPYLNDQRYVPLRKNNAIWIFVHNESMTVPLPVGAFNVVASRGMRWSRFETELDISAGEESDLTLSLEEVISLPMLSSIDPHSHATPSGDGRISMANRLSTMAANGIDIHVSTDHDHIANYLPLLESMGLSPYLETIVGEEVSTVLRGHFNIYPATESPTDFNRGAVPWWQNQWSTPELFDEMMARAPNGVIQLNHPVGNAGMISYSEYSSTNGTIGSPEHWSNNFVGMEVLNDGSYSNYLPYYIDFISRGLKTTAIGVSDSHGVDNGVGDNFTIVPAESADEAILAMRNQQTVVSRGPYIHATINDEWAPGNTYTGSQDLLVEVHAPDWVDLVELEVWENEQLVQTLPITETQSGLRLSEFIDLDPLEDSHYIIMVHGGEEMPEPYSGRPWAMAAAILIDVNGDGWEPIKSAVLE